MLSVLIDDIRDLPGMDVIIRDPEIAVELFTQLYLLAYDTKQALHLYLDNDMGKPTEGIHILQEIISNDTLPDRVTLVTSNPVARERMKSSLAHEGYRVHPNGFEFILN